MSSNRHEISGPMLEHLQHLHSHLWGENVVELTQLGEGRTCSTVDLTLFDDLHACHGNSLFVRDEYRRIYDKILARIILEDPQPISFLVLGQTGIGKSLFLPYLLARRLQERQLVALQTGKHIALFDEQGVRFYPADDEASRYFLPRGTWILSDSSQEGDPEPCRAFRRPKSGVHTVYMSSPDSRHWKRWAKHRSAIKFFMDVWSPKEFEKLLILYKYDLENGVALVQKFGPSPRTILSLLRGRTTEAGHLRAIRSAAAKIASQFSTPLLVFDALDFSTDFSSLIFMLRPDRDGEPTQYIPTAFLASTLAVAIARRATAQQHSSFVMFSNHPSLRTTARWFFEHYAHIYLSALDRGIIHGYRRNKRKPDIIPIPTEMISGSTALGSIKSPFNFYWRPREHSFPGIDALIRVGNTIWALQFTLSSTYNSAQPGLDDVRRIMAHTTGVKWRLVIVGQDQKSAESCRDQQQLDGEWKKTRIYACTLPLGKFSEANLQQLQEVWKEPEVRERYLMRVD